MIEFKGLFCVIFFRRFAFSKKSLCIKLVFSFAKKNSVLLLGVIKNKGFKKKMEFYPEIFLSKDCLLILQFLIAFQGENLIKLFIE